MWTLTTEYLTADTCQSAKSCVKICCLKVVSTLFLGGCICTLLFEAEQFQSPFTEPLSVYVPCWRASAEAPCPNNSRVVVKVWLEAVSNVAGWVLSGWVSQQPSNFAPGQEFETLTHCLLATMASQTTTTNMVGVSTRSEVSGISGFIFFGSLVCFSGQI